MSWGRIDDNFWEHPKTEALFASGNAAALQAIGAFWIIDSYCHRNRRGSFKLREAAMLLRCTESEAASILLPLTVAPDGFEHGFLLQSKTEGYTINSFAEYLGKNEAKVIAGHKGGKKSGKTRRSKREARREADNEAEQKSAEAKPKLPTPIPTPVPDPDPETRHQENVASSSGGEITSLPDLEALASKEGWSTHLGSTEIKDCRAMVPLKAHEVAYALDETRKKKPRRAVSYFLGVIRGQRDDEEANRRTRLPPAREAPRGRGWTPFPMEET